MTAFRRLLRVLPLLVLFCVLAWGHFEASAQTPAASSSPRAAQHDGYGRIVFDWDRPVQYSADVVNGELVVRFDRPVKGDFRGLVRPLAKYLRGVSVSSDRQTASFPLVRPIQVKAFVGNNNAVVIDLADRADDIPTADGDGGRTSAAAPVAAATEQSPPDGPVSLLPQSVPAAPPPPPASRTITRPSSGEPSQVEVRAGDHGSYSRVVFTWPQAVPYKVEKQGGHATVSFSRPARFDLAGLQGALPSDIAIQSTDGGGKSSTVVLSVPVGARLRHFSSGAKVVLDVVRDAGDPPPASNGKPASSEGDVTLPSLKPLTQEDKPRLPSESLTAPAPAAASGTTKATAPAKEPAPPAVAPPSPPPPPPAAPEPPPPAVSARPAVKTMPAAGDADKVFSLSVSWEKPVAAAVFRRAGYLWLIFDRKQDVDTKLLRRLGGEAVSSIQQLPNREATVLRLLVQPDYTPSVRRDGLLWVIDLLRQPDEPKDPIPVTVPASLPNGIGISLAVADAGNVISVADPEVGDSMLVVPVIPLGAGVYPGRDTPDVELLPTVQGIAMLPHVDGLDVRSTRGTVSIGMPSGAGLRLSTPGGHSVSAARHSDRDGFFDVGNWKRGGPDAFAEERRTFEAGLSLIPPAGRSGAHMEAAQFFFANGFAAEALGFLRLAAEEDPTLVDTGSYRALRGACQFLMGRYDLALADLDSPLVKDDAESRLWQAAAHAAAGDSPANWDKALASGVSTIGGYPKPLAWPLAVNAAKAALAAADDDATQKSLDILDRSIISPREEVLLDYLHGAFNEMAGQFDKALDDYDHATKGDNREYRARAAVAATELLLRLGRISPIEAANRLDHLRFAWREEDFEFGLLKRLAELQVQAGAYPDALRSMRSLLTNYPDNRKVPEVSKMMSDTFSRLYLEGAADSMSAVSAIGLYDEFRDLTPTGAKGDEMIRRLADRLAAVDLLDRAAELLKHQVAFRLQGLDKGRVGAQLALLDLLNFQPQAALDALTGSEVPGLPDELQRQRKHLKARALSDLDRVPEGIQLLVGDASAEAMQLRAEIYWRKQDWANAALAFEAMVAKPDRGTTLDDASAKLVVVWATCLVLGNDERGLAALRRSYGPALAATPYNDGFNLLTSALDKDVPDMPAIAGKIKEAQGFQSFMGNYKKRVQSNGLSAIN
ncbi:tetratricopeptide repeat protein [Telmatospirillum sp.]|uniref:tetratricopeptide repeat protein n=1 Tax=Telmatospirillum sp. TaxID=2079197 RepID=UPI00283BFF7E|nr:tetratricopeptide repeat protein [Telmatospirillum sp.]MDR3438523.1 tetratricopeptide repeat protein [Telmatospirillum sp.]